MEISFRPSALYKVGSRRIRKILVHKRFRTALHSFFVTLIFLIAIFPRAQYVFGQTIFPETNATIATNEIIVTTKNTSRFPVAGPLSQGFTYYHPGIDIEQAFNTPIHPFLGGIVFEAGSQGGGYGNYVLIDHKNGYFSLYAHLNKILVTKDEEVTQDTEIGTIGLTGHTTGPHLHLEIYENNIAVNPLTILPEFPLSSASANHTAFTGGPQSIPTRPLVLPISSQASITNPQQTANGQSNTVTPTTTTSPLHVWLPDGLTKTNSKETVGSLIPLVF